MKTKWYKTKAFFIGMIFAVTGTTIAAGITHKLRTDALLLGIASSGDDKVVEFDTGDGASNKKITLDGTTKNGSFNINDLTLGDGAASDKQLIWDIGGSNPRIKWDDAAGALQFSNDGSTFAAIGSGGGGGAGVNILLDSNPDFEDGSPPSDWTSSGGTFVVESTNPGFGLQSGKWDPSATSQTLSSALIAIPDGLLSGPCMAQISYEWSAGSAGDLKLQAYDGTNVLAEKDLIVSSTWVVDDSLAFSCPSSGSVRLRLISTADAAEILVDKAHLGSNLASTQIGVAEFVGKINWAGVTNCVWSTASGSFANFGVDADCNAPTVTGNVSAPATQIPAVKLANMPAGSYKFIASGTMTRATGTCQWRFSDGTDSSELSNVASDFMKGTIVGEITKTLSGSDIEINIQAKQASGATCQVSAADANNDFTILVYRYPLQNQQGALLSTSEWHVDVNIGGANVAIPSSISAYAGLTDTGLDMVLNPGSQAAEIACATTVESTGLTCSGAESIGVSMVIPRAGTYMAIMSFHNSTDRSGQNVFQLTETPNNAQTISQEGNIRIGTGGSAVLKTQPVTLTGIFEFSSAGKKTIRLMHENNMSGGTTNDIAANRAAIVGQQDIHFYMSPVIENKAMPFVVGEQVTIPGVTNPVVFSILVSNSGTPTLSRELGTGLDSFTDNGVGDITVNLLAGLFSADTFCVCTAYGSSGEYCSFESIATVTSSSVQVRTTTDANAPIDVDFGLTCYGIK